MTDLKDFSFEQAFCRLEEILETMNSGQVTLEDSLRLYEEADQLIGLCNKRLKAGEERIELLIKNRNGEISEDQLGKPLLQDFHLNG